jgi:hypothetical protein
MRHIMRIGVEVFSDGIDPITCARNFKTNKKCQFLGTKKLGTVDICTLYVDEQGAFSALQRYTPEESLASQHNNFAKYPVGWLKPCPACITARGDSLFLSVEQKKVLSDLHTVGGLSSINPKYNVTDYKILVRYGLVFHCDATSSFRVTVFGGEYCYLLTRRELCL